ncbi:hypothetical protein HMN09_01006900 [Mycena chlorophos]|uniref:F-box domain-containing protein n=1 Tax=Mycena chlorophos TaxID=658473 RepID=A0A8H6SE54_MYCCL|nr:hypothetical protein HMN09_01006900 [Mycena chlorophos]
MAAPSRDFLSTLPPELLGDIFSACASLHADAPLILGAVSRLFRQVAHSTPRAWTHLLLDAQTPSSGSLKAALFSELSRVCPLRVRLDLRSRGRQAGSGNVHVPGLGNALRAHTTRFDALELLVNEQKDAVDTLGAIYSGLASEETGLLALRALRIDATKKSKPGPLSTTVPVHPPIAFPAVPTIEDLETTNIALDLLPSLGLENLTSLRVLQPLLAAPLSADHIVDLLRSAPRLRKFWVDARVGDSDSHTDSETVLVSMPELEELHLRTNNLIPLLDRLSLPRLNTLFLDDMDGNRPGASEEVAGALYRLLVRTEDGGDEKGNSELREFELVGVAVDRETEMWGKCLQKMRALVGFRVGDDSTAVEAAVAATQLVDAWNAQKRGSRSFSPGFGWAGDI